MGTGNFYNKNASRIFAIETEEQWDYEDACDNARYVAEDLCSKHKRFIYDELNKHDNERNFSGKYIFSLSSQKEIRNVNFSVTVTAIIRSGYYSGVNLDWEAECSIDRDSFELDCVDEKDIARDIEYYNDATEKSAAQIAAWGIKWLQKEQQLLINAIEKVFARCSTPLVVTARFSNGETWYGKPTKRNRLKNAING